MSGKEAETIEDSPLVLIIVQISRLHWAKAQPRKNAGILLTLNRDCFLSGGWSLFNTQIQPAPGTFQTSHCVPNPMAWTLPQTSVSWKKKAYLFPSFHPHQAKQPWTIHLPILIRLGQPWEMKEELSGERQQEMCKDTGTVHSSFLGLTPHLRSEWTGKGISPSLLTSCSGLHFLRVDVVSCYSFMLVSPILLKPATGPMRYHKEVRRARYRTCISIS